MAESAIGRNTDLFLVGGMLAVLLVLFAPIPPFLLDLFIIVNFAFGLTILLLTFYVGRPVEFSTFPSLLLVATLYRLALNVAATRLILTGADAGAVIGSIGSFAVQGNFVIGLVVFFILVVVQYVVVTSGAQRVSEVAARFVLDSLPGQQMSIDADLNMGLIDQDEAKRRRKGLEKEAAFYGAMDGASKFVKGDAIAGIIILLIDILAGWIVGVVQMEMSWLEALRTFTLLTIGDGIVTQVPALIISVATGIIVTRSSADQQLAREILAQLGSVPRIPLIVLAALVGLLLPGMPKWPILLLCGLSAAIFLSSRRASGTRGTAEIDQAATAESAEDRASQGVPPVEILFGSALSAYWRDAGNVLADRVQALRSEREQLSGQRLPAVTFRDGPRLGPHEYQIMLLGSRHGQSSLYPDDVLAIRSGPSQTLLGGIETRDPAFGLPAVWIGDDDVEQARANGFTLVDPITVLMTHLGEILRAEAPMLLSRTDVAAMLEGVRIRQPGLVEELIPGVMSISDVQRVLQNLVAEEVSIRNVDRIVETLVDAGRASKDAADLTELVREKLSHGICSALRGPHADLAVLSLDPQTEAEIDEAVRRGDPAAPFVIDPRLAERLVRKLIAAANEMMQQSLSPVLICAPSLRRHLKAFARRSVPRLAVISVGEIPYSIDLRSFAVLSAKTE